MGERTMEYYIRFWVNSIHSFVGNEDGTEPKIILVGTHLDKLKGDDLSKKKQADTYFDNIRELFKGKQTLKHIFPQDFALDTKNDAYETFNKFRKALLCVGQLYTTTQVHVPAKWIQLEKMLFSRREMKIIEFRKLMEIDSRSEFPLRDPEQVKVFLKHQHDQGTLFYFDEEPISEYVVLDPQFLVDAFKGLITADRFLRNRPDVYDLFQTLKAEGKLEPELIEKLWTNGEDKLIIAHKRTILWFLQKHRIISEAMEFDETNLTTVGLGWYVIPSLLKDHSQVGEMIAFLRDKKQTKIQFVLSFDSSSVVPTVYHRLTAAVIGRWPIAEFRKRKLLFENLSVVRLGYDHAGIIEMNDRHIHLYVLNLSPPRNVSREIPDSFRRFTESVITYEFRKYKGKRKDMNLPYTRGYVCNHESHELSCSKTVSLFTQLDTTSSLLCPDIESHSRIDTVEAKDEWYLGNKIPDISSNVVVSEKMISELSQTIGRNWELLGPDLGLKQVKIDHIIEENPESTGMKIYKMLQLWRNKKRNFATLDALIKILKKRSDVRVDWDGIMNIVDRLN
ncbi:uncharacterized protein LOC123561745 [Mercenaria mercenaria]|uniref:uncharacterized protein LOC123561745 n=1 Tax=Mercenaria mercenaria TaxID=6596 RepID=UPI00234F9F54|nr:uncharacterized protein LOC123561745 [Mercenaria mercenaria]